MPNYKLGKIYKVVNDVNEWIYVGSTAQQMLSHRMRDHRYNSKDITRASEFYLQMRKVGADHFKIVLIKSFPCESKEELEAEEYKIIYQLETEGINTYNSMKNGKHSEKTKDKCVFNKNFVGSVVKHRDCWVYTRTVRQIKTMRKSFSITKYGDAEAKRLAELQRTL